jgi:chromosome segregation ATPase
MIKKMLFIGGGAVAVVAVCFGGAALSYLRTSASYVSESVENAVPLEFQIDRARQMIADLDPVVRRNMHLIAKEEAELEHLEKQVGASQAHAEKDREQIMTLKSDLTNKDNVFRYAGRSYSRDQVKIDLTNRFKRFKTSQATLESLQRVCEARQRSLDAARAKLEGMRAAKRQLLVEVENLEAQRQMVDAAKTTADYRFDDSKLGRVKELINDLQVRLDTERKLVDAETCFPDEIPLEEVAPEDIVEQVTQYFGPENAQSARLAQQ